MRVIAPPKEGGFYSHPNDSDMTELPSPLPYSHDLDKESRTIYCRENCRVGRKSMKPQNYNKEPINSLYLYCNIPICLIKKSPLMWKLPEA
jgi:hypothetical protein